MSLVREKWLVALVKPQFEWAKPDRRFQGVVESDDDLRLITAEVIHRLWSEGSYVNRIALSPLRGAKGNREFFFFLSPTRTVSKESILASLDKLSAKRLG